MVLVDSSVWIEAARRQGRIEVKAALRGLLREFEATWCGPVKLEVLGGARREERRALEFFFEVIPYHPTSDEAWNEGKTLAWRLRDAGLTIPWNDVLIASLALKLQCRVYAVDKHFDAMAKLLPGLLMYEPGYGGDYNPN